MGGSDNRVYVDGTGSLVFYDDEKLKAYEIGFKSAFLDGRAQLTGALYYYDYEDYQDHVETWETSSGDFDLPAGITSHNIVDFRAIFVRAPMKAIARFRSVAWPPVRIFVQI